MRIFNFMKYKHLWYGISGIILAIGLIFGMIHGGFAYGIDFTGGSSITLNFNKPFTIEQVRTVMDKYDKDAVVTYAGNNNEMALIKTKVGFDVKEQGLFKTDVKQQLGLDETNIQIEFIGPAIGDQLKHQAILAVILANLGILIYVSFRFEWKFGLAAVLALVHDIAIMFVVYAVMQIPLSSAFIAALLTIIGYSINDTIVIFDRIRENLRTGKKLSDDEIVNNSVSQTLVRSINTLLTVLITLLALYFLGVPSIKDFAFPMLIGVISGGYSSIFIASPLWVFFRKRFRPAHSR